MYYNEQEFERNYKFIDQIKKKERKLLRRQLENVDIDENERVRIRLQLQRMVNIIFYICFILNIDFLIIVFVL